MPTTEMTPREALADVLAKQAACTAWLRDTYPAELAAITERLDDDGDTLDALLAGEPLRPGAVAAKTRLEVRRAEIERQAQALARRAEVLRAELAASVREARREAYDAAMDDAVRAMHATAGAVRAAAPAIVAAYRAQAHATATLAEARRRYAKAGGVPPRVERIETEGFRATPGLMPALDALLAFLGITRESLVASWRPASEDDA